MKKKPSVLFLNYVMNAAKQSIATVIFVSTHYITEPDTGLQTYPLNTTWSIPRSSQLDQSTITSLFSHWNAPSTSG